MWVISPGKQYQYWPPYKAYTNKLAEAEIYKSFDFPKLHAQTHVFDDKKVSFATIVLDSLNNYMAHSRFGTSDEQILRM